jgi:Zn-dependent protease with chaperone function
MINAVFFDGRSALGQAVQLRVEQGMLLADGEPAAEPLGRWPLRAVQWPERTRHGQRVLHLPGGGSLQVADATAFDAWRRAQGVRESWVVRMQQHWPATLASALALVLVLAAGYRWGVPLAARTLLLAVPMSADEAVGSAALQGMQPRWLQASAVPAERQAQIRAAFAHAIDAAYRAGERPRWELRFHAAHKALGANALAFPGGHIVVTDAMVEMLAGHDDTLVGVLAHEMGHVRRRHGMQGVVQFALIGSATALALGDFSTLLAGMPALLAQLSYTRDAEREADAEAVRVLRAAGLSPAAMEVLFERLAQRDDARGAEGQLQLPTALASHPLDKERIDFFRAAAR